MASAIIQLPTRSGFGLGATLSLTDHFLPSPLLLDILYYVLGLPLLTIDITLTSYWFPLSA